MTSGSSDTDASSNITNSVNRYPPIPITRVRAANIYSASGDKKKKIVVREVRVIPASEAIRFSWPEAGSSTVCNQPTAAESAETSKMHGDVAVAVEISANAADTSQTAADTAETTEIVVDVEAALTANDDTAEVAKITAELEEAGKIAVAAAEAAKAAKEAAEIKEAMRAFVEAEEIEEAMEIFAAAEETERIRREKERAREAARRRRELKKQQQEKIRAARKELARKKQEEWRCNTKEAREKRLEKARRKSAEYRARMREEARSLPREFRGLEPEPRESTTASDSSDDAADNKNPSTSSGPVEAVTVDANCPSTSQSGWRLEDHLSPVHLKYIRKYFPDAEWPLTRFQQRTLEQLESLDLEDDDDDDHGTPDLPPFTQRG